jgi:nucleoside-diphosphate-sugar epimerase
VGRFDNVVNLAACGVTPGSASESEMTRVKSVGASVLAQVLAELAVAPWFVHASSSTEPNPGEDTESAYSRTKAEGTSVTRAQLHALGLAHAIVRIHNAYRARQLEGRFVMAALTALRRGERFTPQFPDRVRDFCLADDVARHLADVLESPPGREVVREIGTRRALSIAEAPGSSADASTPIWRSSRRAARPPSTAARVRWPTCRARSSWSARRASRPGSTVSSRRSTRTTTRG